MNIVSKPAPELVSRLQENLEKWLIANNVLVQICVYDQPLQLFSSVNNGPGITEYYWIRHIKITTMNDGVSSEIRFFHEGELPNPDNYQSMFRLAHHLQNELYRHRGWKLHQGGYWNLWQVFKQYEQALQTV